MPVLDESRLLASEPAPGLDCGGCTACCTVIGVVELRKPMRRACDQICQSGCRIYHARPESCRQFNCLWLRGALGPDERLRPDALGLILDAFQDGEGTLQVAALEVWRDAFVQPEAEALLSEFAAGHPLRLNNRDGDWSTRRAG